MQLILALPAGTFGEARISFKLTDASASPTYSDSEVYTLTLTNGHLGAVDFSTSSLDRPAIRCQQAVGREARKFLNKKLTFLSQCLDAVMLYNARAAAGLPSSAALQAAEKRCADASGSGPESRTLLGKIESARAKALDAIKATCGVAGSGDFTQDEDIQAHISMVGCRAEELVSASYNTAKHDLEPFTARSSQGGQPLDTYFPCLVASPE